MRRFIVSIIFVLSFLATGAQSYFLNGDALTNGANCYTITSNLAFQGGTVWYANQLDLTTAFSLEFRMNFGNNDATGADGMVFVLQTVGTAALGNAGAGMGFQGFNPSFGIEFDTFSNPETADMSADHVAFLRNGDVNHNSSNNLAGPIQANLTNTNIEDGQDHIIKIIWNPQAQIVSLYFDCALRLTQQVNLINTIFSGNSDVYWGFTGATGTYTNQQSVCLPDYFYNELNDTAICAGEQIQLAASGNPQGQFEWVPTIGIDDPTSQTPVATPDVTTTYCYTYTDLCNQAVTDCAEIIVEYPPVVIAGNDTVFCENGSVVLNATVDDPFASLQWTAIQGQIDNGANSLNPAISDEGIYELVVTTPLAACSLSDEIIVTQIDLPQLIVNSPLSLCPDESVELIAGNGWDEILWFDNSTGMSNEVNSAGNYDLTVTENNCSVTATYVVSMVDMPSVELGPNQDLCAGSTTTINAGVSGIWSNGFVGEEITVQNAGVYSFEYNNSGCFTGDVITISLTSPPTIELGADLLLCEGFTQTIGVGYSGIWSNGMVGDSITVEATGDYQITVTQGPCVVSDLLHADIIDLPQVDLGEDANYCIGSTITLGADIDYVDSYFWGGSEESPTIDVSESGEYSLTVINQCGIKSDSVLLIFEECDYFIYAPNAFTPDNDGVNDVFFIESGNLVSMELQVYDRWGALVFMTSDMKKPWKGNVFGGDYFAPDGVYNYHLVYLTNKGKSGYLAGHIVLIR